MLQLAKSAVLASYFFHKNKFYVQDEIQALQKAELCCVEFGLEFRTSVAKIAKKKFSSSKNAPQPGEPFQNCSDDPNCHKKLSQMSLFFCQELATSNIFRMCKFVELKLKFANSVSKRTNRYHCQQQQQRQRSEQ